MNSWLSKTEIGLSHYQGLRDKFNPGIPIWLTETAESACGGNPWAATYLDCFRYLEQLGRLAKKGVQVVDIFAHNLKNSSKGIAVLIVNQKDSECSIEIPTMAYRKHAGGNRMVPKTFCHEQRRQSEKSEKVAESSLTKEAISQLAARFDVLFEPGELKVIGISGSKDVISKVIKATGNGSPDQMAGFQRPSCKAFNGKALIIVRPFAGPGKITVTATSEGLASEAVDILIQ